MSLTPAQQQAVDLRGNVLVMAGAGTGKTRTLVERCLACLLDQKHPASIEQLLVVTFTEAAAAEMRGRIRAHLERQLESDPANLRWQEQIALFDTARIGTLHSFCFQLVREHFYELELDPQLAILPEDEAWLLSEETMEALLQDHYSGKAPDSEAVLSLIQEKGKASDKVVRNLVLKLHRYTQTLPDPERWLREQRQLFASTEPDAWRSWLGCELSVWQAHWLPQLEAVRASNPVAAGCADALQQIGADVSRQNLATAFHSMFDCAANCPRGHKQDSVKPFKTFFDEARFLCSLVSGEQDPLEDDWRWVRGQMLVLLGLASSFTKRFAESKRELGVVDFQDLEQYSLKLLWDSEAGLPTVLAREWRQKLRFLLVDEYQDINSAQDKIIECLSGEGEAANRFLVGDVKQSIYRFRLADPAIFQGYSVRWRGGQGQTVALGDNFRSGAGVLDFVNSLFSTIMRREVGGVAYDAEAALACGGSDSQQATLSANHQPVELHLRVKTPPQNGAPPEEGEDEELKDLLEAEKEARLIALRLLDLRTRRALIWDEHTNSLRPADWGDMTVLLRAPARKAEAYAKEFARLNIPLVVERGGFYQSQELLDLQSLLQLLDNPLQDVPVIAVLHSPFVGLTPSELAAIRLTCKGHFWTALTRWHQSRQKSIEQDSGHPAMEDDTFRKVDTFLERYGRWRRLARQVSLCRCLEAVLSETHYDAWVLTQPRGEQRHNNVRRLISQARHFDKFLRQGLFRFLTFLESQRDFEVEPPGVSAEGVNAVRLMSIHQSKGLEFPVVVLADLGKPFNLMDLRAEIILDEIYGLCPCIKPPHTKKTYPSVAHWIGRRRQQRELLGEELRLLYVAATRARDKLLLVGSITQAKLERLLASELTFSPSMVAGARSYSDWVAAWLSATRAPDAAPNVAESRFCRIAVHDDSALSAENSPSENVTQAVEGFSIEEWDRVRDRVSQPYAYSAATQVPAKTSVTSLRRQAEMDAADPEAADIAWFALPPTQPGGARLLTLGRVGRRPAGVAPSAAEVGSAHHSFLQLLDLGQPLEDMSILRKEAQRLQTAGALKTEEARTLDFGAIAAFWGSPLGMQIRNQAKFVRRELAFTAGFNAGELAGMLRRGIEANLEPELVVVQGVVDLALILPNEIWVIDFKTDSLARSEIASKTAKYEPQLQIYALALSRIYQRPVTRRVLYFLSIQQEVEVPPFQPCLNRGKGASVSAPKALELGL